MTDQKRLTNNSIDKAAETLLSHTVSDAERARAQDRVNDWRASFSLPLRSVFNQVRASTRDVQASIRDVQAFTSAPQTGVICSRRLKRMESIITKLRRPEMQTMKLSRMQDIGGCRAIFPDFHSLDQFRQSRESGIKELTSYINSSDYINSPKPDGYRGVHLIVRPVFKNPRYAIWNTRRIEIQIRTALQHAWATTVESVDMFNSENLKIGRGDLKWRRFFALCSSVIALEEGAPIVPGTSGNKEELAREISHLAKDLDPFRKMEGWKVALKAMDRVTADRNPLHPIRKREGWKAALKARFAKPKVELKAEDRANIDRNPTIALVTVDITKMQVFMNTFSNDEIETANEQYTLIEEQIRNGREAHTFLVALNQMHDLKVAYPNLYADTEVFTFHMMRFLRANGY